jgi:hypothetical protein
MRWAGHVARTVDRRSECRVLLERPEGRRPLGRPRCTGNNIKMDIQESGWGGMDWIDLAEDRDT